MVQQVFPMKIKEHWPNLQLTKSNLKTIIYNYFIQCIIDKINKEYFTYDIDFYQRPVCVENLRPTLQTHYDCCLNTSYKYHNIYFTSAFGTIIHKNVPDYSSFYDVLLTYYIQFENVHCSYISLTNSKYRISSLKAFGSSCCHYSQNDK